MRFLAKTSTTIGKKAVHGLNGLSTIRLPTVTRNPNSPKELRSSGRKHQQQSSLSSCCGFLALVPIPWRLQLVSRAQFFFSRCGGKFTISMKLLLPVSVREWWRSGINCLALRAEGVIFFIHN